MSSTGEPSFNPTLLIIREVNVYKLPPRPTTGGWKCAEWLVSDRIWSGRLRLVSKGADCEIRLEDPAAGDLFASCLLAPGKRDASLESVTDSSRYFILRIDDGAGRHAFIGLGFDERNDAFDFNVAISDHEKHGFLEKERREEVDEAEEDDERDVAPKPALDLRLKDGETMRINVKVSSGGGGGGRKLSANGGVPKMAAVGAMKASLAPPPGGFRLRQPLPPPKMSDVATGNAPMAAAADSLEPTHTPKVDVRLTEGSPKGQGGWWMGCILKCCKRVL